MNNNVINDMELIIKIVILKLKQYLHYNYFLDIFILLYLVEDASQSVAQKLHLAQLKLHTC
jgi:hypothetical protein